MLRLIAAVVAGVLVGIVVTAGVEMIGHQLFPHAGGLDLHDPAHARTAIASLPAGALWFVVGGWFFGGLAAGWVAGSIEHSHVAAAIAGGVLMGACTSTMLSIPHPLWMWVIGVLLPIPSALLGASLAPKRKSATPKAA